MAQQLHPSACRAAVVARCAGARDPALFWDAHDRFFAAERLDDATLAEILSALERAAPSLLECVEDEVPMPVIEADIEAGLGLGVQATPTIFINGRVAPSYAAADLSEIIDHIVDDGSR